jgi:hypothetical protein
LQKAAAQGQVVIWIEAKVEVELQVAYRTPDGLEQSTDYGHEMCSVIFCEVGHVETIDQIQYRGPIFAKQCFCLRVVKVSKEAQP